MSIGAIIKQKKIIPVKIDLEFLKKWAEKEGVYYGEPGDAWEWQNYSGGDDLRGKLLILCDQNGYGRGVSLMVHKNYSIELTMNVPPATWDIDLFYRIIASFCREFNQIRFIHEDEKCTLGQLDSLKKEITGHMQRFIKNKLTANYTVFGCVYPITIEQEFIDSIRDVSEEDAHRMYGEYLHAKQELDCGYVYAMLIGNRENDSLVARYIVSKDICMIFPLRKELPLGYSKAVEEKIVRWSVDVGGEGEDGKHAVMLQCPYDQFCSIVNIEKYPRFDGNHVLITVDDEMIQFVKAEMRKGL